MPGGEAKKNTNKIKQTWEKTQGEAVCCQPEYMDWSYFTFARFTEFFYGGSQHTCAEGYSVVLRN